MASVLEVESAAQAESRSPVDRVVRTRPGKARQDRVVLEVYMEIPDKVALLWKNCLAPVLQVADAAQEDRL